MDQQNANAAREEFKRFVKLSAAIAFVLGLVIYAVFVWLTGFASIHQHVALLLGIFGTLALTVGLMALVFYSGRMGYDNHGDGKG